MKRNWLLTLMFMLATAPVAAQQPEQVPVPDLDKPVAPLVAPTASGKAEFCTVSASGYVEDKNRKRVSGGEGFVAAQPWADAQEDYVRQVKTVRVMAATQNRGGEYTGTATYTLNCDNSTENARPAEASIYVEGVTLAGSTQIADFMLKMGGEINDRNKRRAVACKDQKTCKSWDHSKAKDTCRNARGQLIFDTADPACQLAKNK